MDPGSGYPWDMKLTAAGPKALLAALLLVAATAASASKWRNEKSGAAALKESAEGPADFQRTVENQTPAVGEVVGPAAAAAPSAPSRMGLPPASPLPVMRVASEHPAVRVLSEDAMAAAKAATDSRPAPLLPLSKTATNVFLGFSGMLIAGCLMTGGWEKAPEGGAAAEGAAAEGAEAGAAGLEAASEAAAAESFAAQTFAQSVAGLPARLQIRAALAVPENALAEPYVDAMMPARTWRAITLSEQRAIDAWNMSADKAAGRADLFDWLDANAVEGVDAAALKDKLERRA